MDEETRERLIRENRIRELTPLSYIFEDCAEYNADYNTFRDERGVTFAMVRFWAGKLALPKGHLVPVAITETKCSPEFLLEIGNREWGTEWPPNKGGAWRLWRPSHSIADRRKWRISHRRNPGPEEKSFRPGHWIF